jgi:hypothetical protein
MIKKLDHIWYIIGTIILLITGAIVAAHAAGNVPAVGSDMGCTATGQILYYDGANLTCGSPNFGSISLNAGTPSPSTGSDGLVWYDAIQKDIAFNVDGLAQNIVGNYWTQTAPQTVTNTTTPTTILGTGISIGSASVIGLGTFPANFFVPGKTVRISVAGVYSAALVAPTATFSVKLGSVTLASGAITNLLSLASNSGFTGYIYVTCATTGTAGTFFTNGQFLYATGVLANGSLFLTNAGASATANTTIAEQLDVQVTFGTANASNTVKTTSASVEVLN